MYVDAYYIIPGDVNDSIYWTLYAEFYMLSLTFLETLSPTTVRVKQEKCSHLLYTHFHPIMSQTFPLCKNKYLLI